MLLLLQMRETTVRILSSLCVTAVLLLVVVFLQIKTTFPINFIASCPPSTLPLALVRRVNMLEMSFPAFFPTFHHLQLKWILALFLSTSCFEDNQ